MHKQFNKKTGKKKKYLSKLCILNIRKALLEEAKSNSDLFSNHHDLTTYHSTSSGDSFTIKCYRFKDICVENFNWMMKLLEDNMAEYYKNCEWGWDFSSKQEEMSDEAARYIIAFSEYGNPVAFSHFRFDMDHDVNVVYCYELQLEKAARKQGLAKHMMKILDSLCCSYNMVKVVLTVLIHNNNAVTFFQSQGFELDNTSPQNYSVDTFYYILSKKNKEHSIQMENK